MTDIRPLEARQMRRRTSPGSLQFETTAELEEIDEIIGQERAVEAIRLGIGIRRPGYNLFVLGPAGTGKHTAVRRFLSRTAAAEAPPADWCYVHNFKDAYRPSFLKLPQGRGGELRADLDRFIAELRASIPAAFESDEFRGRLQALEEALKSRQEQALGSVQSEAQSKGIALIRTPMGFAFAPAHEGEVVSPEQFRQIPAAEQERIRQTIDSLQKRLEAALEDFPRWEREHRQKVRELQQETIRYAVGHTIAELRRRYVELPDIAAHLDAIEADIVENAEELMRPPGVPPGVPPGGVLTVDGSLLESPALRRYRINVLIENGGCSGAPVIYEDNPAHANLIGRIEHISQFGALATDFLLIKPGALHRANGGYLVVDAAKLLTQPLAYDQLKRALRAGQIAIESLAQALSLVSTVSLEPEPIPLDVKVLLVGERPLYYLLTAYDPEFPELFKIAADFEDELERTDESAMLFARLIATIARREGLKPFTRDAVVEVVDHTAQMAGDAEKLSAHMRAVADVLREADFLASDAENVEAKDVRAAVQGQVRREARARDRVQEAIARGFLLIDTEGAQVGQINGLSVSQLGQIAFGHPVRITARTRMGRGGVVDIEREAKLGGPIHTKGVMILSGFLAERFLPDKPLTLSASLVFEQSYGGVEGDSASLAELIALLSALSGVPIRQELGITGSVNQHGAVQPIGGVNEKIEGFFDVCSRRGFAEGNGVVIPASNVKNLMLRKDVVAAREQGLFHVYPVETADQAMELLMRRPAGDREAGAFPPDSVNGLVQARLETFAEAARRFGADGMAGARRDEE